jgi:uncharacterized protein (DUF1697 family)
MASNGPTVRYAAFLRGINVGGRRVTGEQLCVPFEALGFEEVASFLASGNVVFATDSPEDLEARLGTALEAALGFEVDVFVRTADEVAAIAGCQPFSAEVIGATDGKLQVTFLGDLPAPIGVEEAMAHATDQDRLRVIGREWYWLPASGISTSTLDVRAVERALGRGTTRTHNTVTRLRAKLSPHPAG